MSYKTFFVFCTQALLAQTAFSQCTSRAAIDASELGAPAWSNRGLSPALAGPGLAYNGLAASGFAGRGLEGIYSPAMEFTATGGGSLPVTSTSAIAPTGISIVSENVFEGALSVAGELPFVGTTGMEGAMPSGGAGAINHACGNGVTAMTSDMAFGPGTIPPIAASFTPAASIAPIAAAFGPVPLTGRIGLGGCGRDNIIY